MKFVEFMNREGRRPISIDIHKISFVEDGGKTDDKEHPDEYVSYIVTSGNRGICVVGAYNSIVGKIKWNHENS